MFRRLISFLMNLPFLGCSTRPEAGDAGKSDGGRRVQTRIGDADDLPEHRLPFKIVAVHKNQKPTDIDPFHAADGSWTFFDCQTADGTAFIVGTLTKTTAEGGPSHWGRALLAVRDNQAGKQLVELFAETFGGELSPVSDDPRPPQPMLINTAILAEGFRREAGGGFVEGKNGGWTATKWFPNSDHAEAEVYFNFNLDQGEGEFSEKDPDYADSLLSILAAALRDGPSPPRTPANDPNLTEAGPAFGEARQLLNRRTSLAAFTPNNRYVVYQDRTRILKSSVADLEEEPVEIARFDHSPWQVHVVNDDLDLIVQEGIPETPGVKSSVDPMRIWWISQKNKEKKLLRGPEKDLSLAEKPCSPDGRFVALGQYVTDTNSRMRNKVTHVLDRQSGAWITVQQPRTNLDLIEWKETAAGLRAVAVSNRWGFDEHQPSESFLIDPVSGSLERQPLSPGVTAVDLVSPDATQSVRIGDGEIVVKDWQSGEDRRFSFHKEDRPFVGVGCVDWVSPRYLRFNGPKLALIDTRSMKMSFPRLGDKSQPPAGAYTFSSDFKWVIYQTEGTDGEGVFLAPVELQD